MSRGNDFWLWWSVRNFIGKPYRRLKEGEKKSYFPFHGPWRVLLVSPTKLERIKFFFFFQYWFSSRDFALSYIQGPILFSFWDKLLLSHQICNLASFRVLELQVYATMSFQYTFNVTGTETLNVKFTLSEMFSFSSIKSHLGELIFLFVKSTFKTMPPLLEGTHMHWFP